MGHHAWRQSTDNDVIDDQHATAAIEAAERELRAGLYESRWYDAAPKERTYLQELADLTAAGEPVAGADVARAMGRSPGPLRISGID